MNPVMYAAPPQLMRLTAEGMEKLQKLDKEIQTLRHQQEANSVDHSFVISTYEAERFNLLMAASAPVFQNIEQRSPTLNSGRSHPSSRRGSFSKSPNSGQKSRSPNSSKVYHQTPPPQHHQMNVQWSPLANGQAAQNQNMIPIPGPHSFSPVYPSFPPGYQTTAYAGPPAYQPRRPQVYQNSLLGQVRQKKNYNNGQYNKQEVRRSPENQRTQQMGKRYEQIVVDVGTVVDEESSRDSGYIELSKNHSQALNEEPKVKSDELLQQEHRRPISAYEALQQNSFVLDETQEETDCEEDKTPQESCAKLEKMSRSPTSHKLKRAHGFLLRRKEDTEHQECQQNRAQEEQLAQQELVKLSTMSNNPHVDGHGRQSAGHDERNMMQSGLLKVSPEVQALSPQAQQSWYSAVQAHQASLHANAVHHAAIQGYNQGKMSADDLTKFAQCSYNASLAARQASAVYESIKVYEQSQYINRNHMTVLHQQPTHQQSFVPYQQVPHGGYYQGYQRNECRVNNQRRRTESDQRSGGRSSVATARSFYSTSSSNSSMLENEWEIVNDMEKEMKKVAI